MLNLLLGGAFSDLHWVVHGRAVLLGLEGVGLVAGLVERRVDFFLGVALSLEFLLRQVNRGRLLSHIMEHWPLLLHSLITGGYLTRIIIIKRII